MRLASPIAARRARLEIIPLIDIMFFLLASFMMVSITMIRVEMLRMDLPTPVASRPGEAPPQMARIDVDSLGDAYLWEGTERRRYTLPELIAWLRGLKERNPAAPAYIRGSSGATHGHVVAILDACHVAGITQVSFDLEPPEGE